MKLRRLITGLAAAALVVSTAGCGLQTAAAYMPPFASGSIEPAADAKGAPVTVVSKNFTEQLILGKIAVIAATAAGYSVTDLTNVPGSQPSRQLMVSGQADIAWEYTGTAWLTYLGHEKAIPDQEEQWEAVRSADEQNGLSWQQPAPLNNTYALAMRSDLADRLGITKLSELKDLPVEERTFCVEAEFNSRNDGFTPLLETYDLARDSSEGVPEENVRIMDTGAVYSATAEGACNFGEVFTTDGRIPALDLTVLEDDRHFFPAYNGAVVINSEVLEEHPGLGEVFDKIAPLLTDQEMQRLNARVDVDGDEPADVALDWMAEQGFVTKK